CHQADPGRQTPPPEGQKGARRGQGDARRCGGRGLTHKGGGPWRKLRYACPMDDLITRRIRRLGPNVPTFYERPVHLVRGEGLWLWDDTGKRYLDCYNNVPHVGHCHPHVV